MDGTPKAKARRQSLPSQYHLSSPQATNDDATAHAELVRFRDEMGIDNSAYFHGHPQQYGQYDQPIDSNGTGGATKFLTRLNKSERRGSNAGRAPKLEDQDTSFNAPSGSGAATAAAAGGEGALKKKVRKKWTIEETKMLVDGCNKHGVGNWKSMLDDTELTFDVDRTPVDLKDRFRTYFPEAYRHLYPNAKTHLSNSNSSRARRTELPDNLSIFEKSRSKKRRPFTKEEDEALKEGFEKHGTVWAVIAKNPALASRRSTDLRDRFRNAFPDLYEKAGYKPRPTRPIKNKRLVDESESNLHSTSGGLLKPSPSAGSGQQEGSGSEKRPTTGDISRRNMGQVLSQTPEEDVFEDSGCVVDDEQEAKMDMDGDHDDDPFSSSARKQADGSYLRPALVPIPSSSSDGSVVPSRQRSPSNARNPNQNNGNVEGGNSEYLSPNVDHHAHLRQSPGHPSQQHIAQQQNFNDASWYPARWLSGGQGHGEEMDHGNAHLNAHNQSQFPGLMADYPSQGLGLHQLGGSNPVGLSSGNLGMLGLGFGGFSAGGWSNQQTIIDRYDLPSSSQHFLHGGEFQSEAAIGDTGSSISGLDEFNTNLSMSSHHRYAGDLFHGRGAGYGGAAWGNFGFMLGGTQEGMPSFARAGMDLGAPNVIHTPNTNVGLGMPPLDLGSATQSPEHVGFRPPDLLLESVEELGHVLGSSMLGSPHSVDPSKTLLHDVSTPPPGTPVHTSPPLRSFSSLGGYGTGQNAPGVGLVRHGSMGTTDAMGHGHGRLHQNSNQHYPQGHHNAHHTPGGGGSHSRSFSQPPSEARLPMGMGRSSNTTVPSPSKGTFQLDGNAYGMGFDGGHGTASPVHIQHHFSPAGTPNQALRTLEGQRNQSPQHHSQAHLQSHSHHHHQQQQRTPVQSHASLQAFNSLYPPSTQLNGAGNPWNQLSTAAMALDLHGFQTYQAHAHPHTVGQQGLGLVTNGLSIGGTANGYGNAGHFMDQYLDFDTNALDLATAVNPPSGGGSFASGMTFSMSSPDLQMNLPAGSGSVGGQGQAGSQGHVQHAATPQMTRNASPQRNSFQLSSPTPATNHSNSHGPHNQPMAHHNSFGPPAMSIGSMDDSMATQPNHQPGHGNINGGMHRRESFSYGTTGPVQTMATPTFIPLHRVQSAGANSTTASPSISHASNTSSNTSGSSGSHLSQKGKGWDKTVTARSAKRASWGAFKSFNAA